MLKCLNLIALNRYFFQAFHICSNCSFCQFKLYKTGNLSVRQISINYMALRTRIGEIYLVFKASSHTFPVLFLGHASDLITTSRSQIEQIIVSTLTLLCSHQIIQFAATK